jgi:drug/metabolite transporter (DMT)-like permease
VGEVAVRRWLPDFALIVVTVVWGSTFIVNARTIDHEPPILYSTLRFAVAAVLMLPFALRRARSKGLLSDSVGMGILLAAGMATQIVGQTETSAAKTAFITGLSVPLTPIAALWRTRRPPSISNLAGIVLASGGFFLLAWPKVGGGINRGDGMVLLCAASFAIYIVENAERAPRHDVVLFTALQLVFATASLAAVTGFLHLARPALAITPVELRPLVPDRSLLLAIAYMATFATIGTLGVQTWAQTKMSATHAAIIFALEPVWAAIFAAFILAEVLTGRILAGGALVVAGIIVSEVRLSSENRA